MLRCLEALRKGRGLSFKSRAIGGISSSGGASRVAFLSRLLNDGRVIQLLLTERSFKMLDAPGGESLLFRQGVFAMKRGRVVKSAPLELTP